ncbi:MAG: AAA-like domain-containing protein [Microcoleaceae cyanobacterium]
MSFEFPLGPVPLNSPFYVKRPQLEEIAFQEIIKPGGVIRIKAPKYTGKSSLLLRIIDFAKSQGYQIVNIDFRQADTSIFTSLDKFLRWFCANVTRQLNLDFLWDDYWDEDIGSKVSCTIYFQMYLLQQINVPLVLTLEEVNVLFEYPNIAQDFFPLLRSWHDEAKQDETLKKLRFIVVHNTEIYIPLNINQSPFNIGKPIKLPEFTLEEVHELAQIYGLKWTQNCEAEKLMAMVGGHPYLVRLALDHLVNNPEISLEQLLEEAPQITGIYHSYLREHLDTLQRTPELGEALEKVMNSPVSVKIDHLQAYKLESMGLVKLDGNNCTISCQLYRVYFGLQKLEKSDLSDLVAQLQKSNKEWQKLSYLDDLTQIYNRRKFELTWEEEWEKSAKERDSLSLILCDIDYIKIYNDEYGRQAGDNCLRQVAKAIQNTVVNHSNYLVARYGGDEFAIILPETEAFNAVKIAERIRAEVKKLALAQNALKFGGLPASVITISLGVAGKIPKLEEAPSILVNEAEKALYRAKKEGRDRVSCLQTEIV